jgi:hypothetical protein|nr:MAG TPA: hypothetical protein [Bacteriophage sp.]
MKYNRFSKYDITLQNGQGVNVYDAFEALSDELQKEFIEDVFNNTFAELIDSSADRVIKIIDGLDTDLFDDFTRKFAQLMAERAINYTGEVINNKL